MTARPARPMSIRGPTRLRSPNTSAAALMCPRTLISTTTTTTTASLTGRRASTARWPWMVGVAAIVAAIALVVSVSLLFARTDTSKLGHARAPRPTSAGRRCRTRSPPPRRRRRRRRRPASRRQPPDADGDGDAAATAPATAGAAPARRRRRRRPRRAAAPPPAEPDAGRASAGHLLGDRHQSAVRQDHDDLRRRRLGGCGPCTTCTSRGR